MEKWVVILPELSPLFFGLSAVEEEGPGVRPHFEMKI